MTEREEFGAHIVVLRTIKKISQEQLAELAGVTRNNLSRIENGKYDPRFDTLQKIGKALGLKLKYVE
jgi:transcriptional regulator with XRE-family HTH domain